jgi:hypothetical protein
MLLEDELVKKYTGCMAEIGKRVKIINAIIDGKIAQPIPVIKLETVALNLRKCLELIVFSHLSANKDKYAESHENFANEWRIHDAEKGKRGILDRIKAINPNYYPHTISVIFDGMSPGINEIKHRDNKNCMSEKQLIDAYNYTSKILHTGKPFNTEQKSIKFDISEIEIADMLRKLNDYKTRVYNLLDGHTVMIDNETQLLCLMNYPDSNTVFVQPMTLIHELPNTEAKPTINQFIEIAREKLSPSELEQVMGKVRDNDK